MNTNKPRPIQVVALAFAVACAVVLICVPSLPPSAGRWISVAVTVLAAVALLTRRSPQRE